MVEATIYVSNRATFLAVIQNVNIKTPQWMDFIVQRPESHSIHCATGVHAFNYSDLPLFNMLLATVRILKRVCD